MLKHRQKPSAPTAKMIPITDAARNPSFESNEQSSTEPKSTENTPKKSKTPGRRRRVRRIGSRLGSEDDEDYTPRKSKRKRTSSPKSSVSTHRSGSSRVQKDDDAQQQVGEAPSPTENIPLKKSTAKPKPHSPFNSATLMDRFKDPKKPSNSPSTAISTQDSSASASQSQRTVDIVQQYPTMGDHIHTFPAEPQVARMSSGRNGADAHSVSLLNEGPDLLSPQQSRLADYQMQLRLLEHQRARIFAQRDTVSPISREQTAEAINVSNYNGENSNKGNPLDTRPSRVFNVSERTTTGSDSHCPNGPSGPTVDMAAAAYSPMSTIQERSTEQGPSSTEAVQAIATNSSVTDSALINRMAHNAQATQPNTMPPTNLPQLAPIVSTAQSIRIDTTRQSSTAKSALQIRYTIITSRVPRFSRLIWGAGGLSGKSMDSLCDEIAVLIGRPISRCISFNLNLSEGDVSFVVERSNPDAFEEMREIFTEEIKNDRKNNSNKKFEITLEPDPTSQVKEAFAEVKPQEDRGDDIDFRI